MYKKTILLVLVACLFFLLTNVVKVQATAEYNETQEVIPEQMIVPLWDYTNYTNTILTILVTELQQLQGL